MPETVSYPPSAIRFARRNRTRAQDDLAIAWAAWKAAAWYVQTLDSPIVPLAEWEHADALARQVLESMSCRVIGWRGPYTPAASLSLRELRDVLIAHVELARDAVTRWDYNASMAYLWTAGTIIYAWMEAFGLEVY